MISKENIEELVYMAISNYLKDSPPKEYLIETFNKEIVDFYWITPWRFFNVDDTVENISFISKTIFTGPYYERQVRICWSGEYLDTIRISEEEYLMLLLCL